MRILVLAALLAPAASASAGPCLPESYCPPCPYYVTIENGKPVVRQAQC